MLIEIIKFMTVKAIVRDIVKMGVKNANHDDSVVKEKLGVSTIDEFMKMDIHEYKQKDLSK